MRLAHRHAREVGEDAVGETLELQLAGTDEPDQRVLRAAKAFANARSVAVAASLLSAT